MKKLVVFMKSLVELVMVLLVDDSMTQQDVQCLIIFHINSQRACRETVAISCDGTITSIFTDQKQKLSVVEIPVSVQDKVFKRVTSTLLTI